MPYSELLKGRVSETHRAYFITTVTQHRMPFFYDLYCARDLVKCIRVLHDSSSITSLCWVIMPDHLHWLFQLNVASTLPGIINRLKGSSSRIVNQRLERHGQLWQKSYYDHAIRDAEDIRKLARYIVANPLRARLALKIGDYPHWDSIWL